MTPSPDWHLVVPVKGGATAKSRLHPPVGVGREELALALATDCLAACCAGMPPGRIVVVTSDAHVAKVASALGTAVVPDPGAGLNAAVAAGRDHALAGPAAPSPAQGESAPSRTPASDSSPISVAVLLGDLPALRAQDLEAALDAAAAYPLAMVPDASGSGTVLLTALDGQALLPSFGDGSCARHVAGGHLLLDLDLPRLRTDVDDDLALRAALDLGVGPATRRVLEPVARLRLMQASVHTFDDATGSGSALLDDGREVTFSADVFAASALRHLRVGQRLSVDLGSDTDVTKLWIVGIGDDQRIG